MHKPSAITRMRATVAAGTIVLLMGLAPSPAAALSPPVTATCDGEVATIVSAAATVVGTAGDDVIVATGSAGQTIRGGAGDDLICGTPAADRIFGGNGGDTIFGGSGNDIIDGWNGSDTIHGNMGRDTISGGTGDDHLIGGVGEDVISGNTGADMVAGGGGADRVAGGWGRDSLDGGAAADMIDPGAGSDYCTGDPTDTMMGDCAIDRTGPSISDVTMPASTRAGETLSVTWRVADPNGVANTLLSIGGAQGWITSWCGFAVQGEQIGGTMFDGTYRLECALPANAVNGTYTLFFSASDSFGNGSPWDRSTQYDFEVTDGSNDIDPVSISEVTAETTSDGEFLVRFRAIDESGVDGVWAFLAWGGDDPSGRLFYNFASWYGTHLDSVSVERVSGDEFDGVWEQRFRVREFTPTGNYGVWIGSRDTVGNRLFTGYDATIRI